MFLQGGDLGVQLHHALAGRLQVFQLRVHQVPAAIGLHLGQEFIDKGQLVGAFLALANQYGIHG